MDRSDDFSLEDTYQWLKKEFPGLQSNTELVQAILAELVKAYGNGRNDGRAEVSEEVSKDLKRLYS